VTHYFLDTSALVKRYVTDEVGHAWMTSLFVPTAGNTILIAEIALAETVCTFCLMARGTPPRVSVPDRDALISLFRDHDARREYYIVPVGRDIFLRAGDLSRAHPLRTYDAVQLACAFQARDDARTAGVASTHLRLLR
jgi:predicted nucleic acid-binding protein